MSFLKPDKTYTLGGVTVKDFLLTEHKHNNTSFPGKRTRPLLGVTIHNTEKITVVGTTMSEQYVRATVNGNMGQCFVHYYVDETEAWHLLPDDQIGWHAADGANGDGNCRTIAIEIIGNSPKAEENGAKLAAGLLAKYALTTDNLYTHSHWINVFSGKTGTREYLNTLKNSRKNCPVYILPHWADFEARVAAYMSKDITDASAPTVDKPKTIYRVQVGAYSSRENAETFLKEVKAKGLNGFIVEITPDNDIEVAPKKTAAALAEEILAGLWGNGEDRKKRLTAAGYDCKEVQAAVNARLKG